MNSQTNADRGSGACDDYVVSVRLTDGTVIHKLENGHWPEFQKARPSVPYACDVCPIRKFCGDNNEFDCQVYGMFTGFYLEDEFEPVFDNRWDTDEAIRRAGAVATS